MPKGVDWIYFTYVNLGFIALIVSMYYFSALADIKANWPLYRCNPIYMPLSDDIEKDFTYCVQNMQTDYMGYLLQPLTYITSGLTQMGGDFTESLNDSRNMLANIRNFFTSIIQNIFGVFLNLITEFQKITIGIKDLVGKLIGIMVVVMYVMDGSIKTMQSTWNGPAGQSVRALSGNCFHPSTRIKLKTGKVIKMKDAFLGDILESGSKVIATMQLIKTEKDKLYVMPHGVNNIPVYVTGSHMVFNKATNKFIDVQHHPDAKEQSDVECEYFSCLITDDHHIQIGQQLFYDYDDDEIRAAM